MYIYIYSYIFVAQIKKEKDMGKIFNPGIIVSIGNQKGGVGKSVITSLAANYFHKYYGKKKLNIAVVDADDLQASLSTLREVEIKDMSEKEKSKLYQLVKISSFDVPSQIEILQEEFDIIFIDLPGNLKQPGVITVYFLVDILFVPSQASSFDIDSTWKFLELYKDVIKTREENNLKTDIFGIFSRVDPQNKDFKLLYSQKDQLPIPFLDGYVPESKVTFQRNVSTTDTYESNRHEEFSDLCEEMLQCITQYANKK